MDELADGDEDGDVPEGMEEFDKDDYISSEKVIFAACDYCLYTPCETENSKEEMQRLSFTPFIVGPDCSDAQLYLLATRLRSSYVCSITFAIICAIYKQVPCIPAFATPHFHSDQGL